MRQRGMFDNDGLCAITRALKDQNLLIRITNWAIYVDATIGPDVAFLRRVVSTWGRTSLKESDVVLDHYVRQIIRAEFRLAYFCQGKSHLFNYDLVRRMFVCGKEVESSRAGLITRAIARRPRRRFLIHFVRTCVPRKN